MPTNRTFGDRLTLGSGCFRQGLGVSQNDPTSPFTVEDVKVGNQIAMLTLPTKRLLCTAVIGSRVRFLGHKQPWEGSPDLVAD